MCVVCDRSITFTLPENMWALHLGVDQRTVFIRPFLDLIVYLDLIAKVVAKRWRNNLDGHLLLDLRLGMCVRISGLESNAECAIIFEGDGFNGTCSTASPLASAPSLPPVGKVIAMTIPVRPIPRTGSRHNRRFWLSQYLSAVVVAISTSVTRGSLAAISGEHFCASRDIPPPSKNRPMKVLDPSSSSLPSTITSNTPL